jgi:lipoate-protein ligase A
MAIDEAILIGVGGGHSPPTLRFYGWKPAALSIGYFQKAEDEVDLHELRRRGLGFVRRPTGGRAVLHDNELTYSVIVPESHPGMPASVGDACRLLNRGLACGLRRLGIDARPAGLPDGGKRPVSPAASAACFDSPSSYELVAGGRKIAGSAQMRQRGAILQHGSVPFELDADLLYAVLRFSSERIRDRMKAAFADRAAAVNDLLRRAGAPPVTPEAAEDAFTAGFEEGLGIRLVHGRQAGAGEIRQRRMEPAAMSRSFFFARCARFRRRSRGPSRRRAGRPAFAAAAGRTPAVSDVT